ncbi:MAG: L,D-transpeptidase family protein [Pseudomonadota bacterium]
MHRRAIQAGWRAVLAAWLLTASFAVSQAQEFDVLREAILIAIEHDDASGLGDRGDEKLIDIFIHYEDRGFAPIWVDASGPTKKAEDLVSIFERSHEDALFPGDYGVTQLRVMMGQTDLEGLAALELSLSKALVLYSGHLSAGRTEPNKINSELFLFPDEPNPQNVLDGARGAPDIGLYAQSFAPNTPNYVRLKFKLAKYRKLAANGGWEAIGRGKPLRPGSSDRRIPTIRDRLVMVGDLKAGAHEGDTYDGALVEAVKQFQGRHGSTPDGVIGPSTIADMNVSAPDRVRQIEINMERRRWMVDDLGQTHIFANLADQYMKFVQRAKTLHVAKLIVGQKFSRTPVFSSDLTYLVVNPFWLIPREEAATVFLPQLQEDPSILSKKKIRVFAGSTEVSPFALDWGEYSSDNFPFRLRQDPGPDNELGQFEFEFPNDFGVNFHDTPAKALFERETRTFGDRSILIENPMELAEILISGQGWTRDKIDELVTGNNKRIIKLATPVPVHLTYLTAWTNKDGSMHFRRDIYERDRILAAALSRYIAN